jgi:hypothetical protein
VHKFAELLQKLWVPTCVTTRKRTRAILPTYAAKFRRAAGKGAAAAAAKTTSPFFHRSLSMAHHADARRPLCATAVSVAALFPPHLPGKYVELPGP